MQRDRERRRRAHCSNYCCVATTKWVSCSNYLAKMSLPPSLCALMRQLGNALIAHCDWTLSVVLGSSYDSIFSTLSVRFKKIRQRESFQTEQTGRVNKFYASSTFLHINSNCDCCTRGKLWQKAKSTLCSYSSPVLFSFLQCKQATFCCAFYCNFFSCFKRDSPSAFAA